MVTPDEKENMDPRETLLGPTSSWLPNSNADSDKHSVVLLAYAYDVAMAQMVLRVKSSQDFLLSFCQSCETNSKMKSLD